jgi:DNA-binding transcriptional MerR regulator/effector-binding domain-containing protein
MIGDFARRCRLPVSTLRYYDKIGLVTPAVVDPSTGYRGYTADQLPAAVLVSRLRAIGTAPQDIATVLAGGAPAGAVLAAERRRVEGQVSDAQRALVDINDLLTQHDDLLTYEIRLVSLGPDQVASAPFSAPQSGIAPAVLRGIAGLRSVLRRAGRERTGPWGATFPLEITEQVSGFVFARTSQPVDSPDLDTAWLSATRAVRVVHQRGSDTVALAYDAALDMIEHEGWTPAGPVIEEYLSLDVSPTPTPSIRLTVPIA